jgi:diguanylate cyclase (GGDEF)-like protein
VTDPSWRKPRFPPCSTGELGVRDIQRDEERLTVPAANERLPDRRALPAQLHPEALGLASLLARETRDGIAIVGPGNELIFWNAAAGAITGWASLAIAEDNVRRFTMTPQTLVEIRDGKWVEIRQSVLDVGGRPFTIVIFTDATSQVRLKDAREQLRALGLIDKATNLPGREVAMLHIEQAIAMAKRDKRSVGLMSLKLDRFRQLRDGPDGHAAADEVVRQFAKRISAFVRASDIPARLSDDSFLVVLSALTTSNDAAVVAVRLLLVLAEPFDVVGHARTVHCSIGVAESPRDATDAVTLLGAALAAADRAQVMGGGRFCVASELRAERDASPAPASTAATTPAGSTPAAEAAAAAPTGGRSDGGRDLAGERAEIARQIVR